MKFNAARIVVIDDRPDLVAKLAQHDGQRLIVNHQTPTSPVTNLLERPPHAVVIGAAVPIRRATELCRLIRGTPVLADAIILVVGAGTGRHGATHEADAFAAGADDYVSSPASLAVRLNALLRRRLPATIDGHEVLTDTLDRQSITIGALTIYELDYAAVVAGKRVPLTAGEFRILWKLATQRGRTVTVEQLAPVDLINETYSSLTSVRSLIFSLRGKLGECGKQIETVRRAGYRLVE